MRTSQQGSGRVALSLAVPIVQFMEHPAPQFWVFSKLSLVMLTKGSKSACSRDHGRLLISKASLSVIGTGRDFIWWLYENRNDCILGNNAYLYFYTLFSVLGVLWEILLSCISLSTTSGIPIYGPENVTYQEMSHSTILAALINARI